MELFADNIEYILGGAIVVLGLLVIGLKDVLCFSFRRVWAISGVVFAESIRRRVLWVTPLAIIGVFIVAQLTKPFDEQDAIRQTLKFSIFATGLVVTLTTIILAATNLPKEIENRVIYTVVTKPTTRLEIIVGKVIGFARVSAAILLIMGLFTWGYLHVRAWSLQGSIKAGLADAQLSQVQRNALQHYREAGLLRVNTYAWSGEPQIFSQPPEGDRRWIPGGDQAKAQFFFDYTPADFTPPGVMPDTPIAMALLVDLSYQQSRTIMPEIDPLSAYGIPLPSNAAAEESTVPSTPTPLLPPRPRLQINITDSQHNPIAKPADLGDARGIMLPATDQFATMMIPLPPAIAGKLVTAGQFAVDVGTSALGTQLSFRLPQDQYQPISLRLINPETNQILGDLVPRAPDPQMLPVRFIGEQGTFGQQLHGDPHNSAIAVFAFRNTDRAVSPDGKINFEMNIGIERTGAEQNVDSDDYTELEIRLADPATGATSPPNIIQAESNRNVFFTMPAELTQNGNFNLLVRNLTTGHWVGLQARSVQLVTGNVLFSWNLFKSLLMLWLMSLLVIIIAMFCSTFLSWPIAIVLAVIILLSNWGIQQLGDMGNELGNQVAQQIFGGDQGQAPQFRVVSSSVNTLNKALQALAKVLPDISQFSAGEQLQRGVSMPWRQLIDAAAVAFGFGIPLTVLAYLFLRKKEVAP